MSNIVDIPSAGAYKVTKIAEEQKDKTKQSKPKKTHEVLLLLLALAVAFAMHFLSNGR